MEKKYELQDEIQREINEKKCIAESVSDISDTKSFLNPYAWNENDLWDFYYVNACKICLRTTHVEICKRCKMISYCGEKHRKKHWPQHKDLCKVILGMLGETGGTNLFDNLKPNSMEEWMSMKIELMLRAQSKLGRKLQVYEREMFLFPKTCFSCHESDSSLLKTCDCGISLCKQHRECEQHMEICFEYRKSLVLASEMTEFRPFSLLVVELEDIVRLENTMENFPHHTQVMNLPSSIQKFINTNMELNEEYATHVEERTCWRIEILSEYISKPLTLLYALQKLEMMSVSALTVHIIGAINEEFILGKYWEVLLHWIPNLKDLTIIFIGSEIKQTCSIHTTVCKFCKLKEKSIDTFAKSAKYEDYFQGDNTQTRSFVKPDIIVGFNLEIHESELAISDYSWKNAFSILEKVDAPFVMTAGTSERARKDHEMLCKLLEKTVSYDYSELNPYASLIPERDFETEKLRYTNGWILIYEGIYEGSGAIRELKKQHKIEEIDLNRRQSEISELKGKLKEPKLLTQDINSESDTKPTESEHPVSADEDLLKENFSLKQENKLLKENYQLKEENYRLKKENRRLNQENERLKAENQLIKDLRAQVQESIREAMSEKNN